MKTSSLQNLQTIPGVGKSLAQDLWDIGIKRISCLKNKNPEKLYQKLCRIRGCHIDRCVLYVFRCAVYFSSNERPKPEKLKWWNHSDARLGLEKNNTTLMKRRKNQANDQ
ncbi:MAG: helix-hairpin-helix domain-containing protein [bacterium]